MPNIDGDARRWQLVIAGNAGAALRYWRDDVRGITASKLSRRCTELGFPISRVAISKIENNSRQGKLEVTEVLVLARALQIAPIQLLYPNIPDGRLEYIPNEVEREVNALDWFVGHGTMHRSAQNQQLLVIAGESTEEELAENKRKSEENSAYGDAVAKVRLLAELAEYEREAGNAAQRLRHPSLSGSSEATIEKRESIGQWLTKMLTVIEDALQIMRDEDMVVREEDHHFG